MSAPDGGGAGLASRSNPGRFVRSVQSALMRTVVSPRRRRLARRAAELRRRVARAPHRVEYFHRVDDAYGHLAAQVLERLAAAYDIELVPHLCGPAGKSNEPEPELLAAFARRDAGDIAHGYGLGFPSAGAAPSASAVAQAERLLAAAQGGDFAARAVEVGEALFGGDPRALEVIAAGHPPADEASARARVAAGSARRARRGHYSGAMFHYAGEWYWGVDRLHHLEARLEALGARRPGAAPVAPRPAVDPGEGRDDGRIVLEFFPSLRSPYTAAVYDPTLALAERTGVHVVIRPVLPMVMRGVPATFAKGSYIFQDAAREAECNGVAYGNFVDPIGEPVERAFALWPWARERGREVEFLGAFLRAAFAEGVDTSRAEGMRHVIERAGLRPDEAKPVDEAVWRGELEANRRLLYEELGLWGVPSYRVRGPAGRADYATWGQDRLWRVAEEIESRLRR